MNQVKIVIGSKRYVCIYCNTPRTIAIFQFISFRQLRVVYQNTKHGIHSEHIVFVGLPWSRSQMITFDQSNDYWSWWLGTGSKLQPIRWIAADLFHDRQEWANTDVLKVPCHAIATIKQDIIRQTIESDRYIILFF